MRVLTVVRNTLMVSIMVIVKLAVQVTWETLTVTVTMDVLRAPRVPLDIMLPQPAVRHQTLFVVPVAPVELEHIKLEVVLVPPIHNAHPVAPVELEHIKLEVVLVLPIHNAHPVAPVDPEHIKLEVVLVLPIHNAHPVAPQLVHPGLKCLTVV